MNFITTVLVSAVLVFSVGGKEMKVGQSGTSLHTANRVSIEWFSLYNSLYVLLSAMRMPLIHRKVRVHAEKDA